MAESDLFNITAGSSYYDNSNPITIGKVKKLRIDEDGVSGEIKFAEGVPEFLVKKFNVPEEAEGDEFIIENKVEFRAKLEQLAEECSELAAACMKLVRAMGNGNPCNVTREQAIDKVLEEWSDVEVAGVYMLEQIDNFCSFDIYERIREIEKEKTKRWQDRVRKEIEKQNEKHNKGTLGSSGSDDSIHIL